MLTLNYIFTFLFLSLFVKSILVTGVDFLGPVRDARATGVRLTNSNRDNYGILEVFIEGSWAAVCDDSFNAKAAKVACRQMNFKDGRYQPGSAVGRLAQVVIKAVSMDCRGNETKLSQCSSNITDYCLSNDYVTLYCSHDYIIEKECVEIRIKDDQTYGLLEANMYGFWGPICNYEWTDVEADAACRELGHSGGYAYYATSNNDVPMVVGGFNCSADQSSIKHCRFHGFSEPLGCQYPITKGHRRAAGVLCYKDEDMLEFRLSDRWYGKVQVKHKGEWGRVCNANWGHKEASTLCRQLGYIDGRARFNSNSDNSGGKVRMNSVNCSGSERSILECSHRSGWERSLTPCFDAEAICNITVCGTLDIRNNVEGLEALTNCNIIEGNLTILLIGTGKWEDFQKYSFPNLVEITEFLVLFRVNSLRSLNHLFPNLAIIRGDRLFSDYALVAFEMPDLVELGLSSLVSITRGGVRLEKNPNLCYIETIDWSKITTGVSMSENYFKGNKDASECVNKCPSTCEKTLEYDVKVPRCWTIKECQKNLSVPNSCKSGVYSNGICCDPNCAAGCTGPKAEQCIACKDLRHFINNDIPTCTQRCSPGTYEYKKRRCLLDKECLEFNDYRTERNTDTNYLKLVVSPDTSKPGLCVRLCPGGYDVDPNDQQKCLPCKGKCPKICNGMEIDSLNAAQELKDCNIVAGPLTITIRQGGLIAQELEESLAQIEEVRDFILISHSEALISLHFFKSLRKVGGMNLAYNKYVFYVYDNLNLQELFTDEVMKNIQFGNGSVLFQYNRKLCYNKILGFMSAVGYDTKNINPEDVSSESNGDQISCEIQKLTLYVQKTSVHIAFVYWSVMNITDDRHLIGYSINWKEAPEKNVSIYQGRDACSDDLWKSKDIDTAQDTGYIIDYIVGLEPWTQYAAYVKALTVSKSVQGGISDIIYFRTDAEVPTPPIKLQVKALTSGELEVTWDPPDKPNGNVTHYEVYWQRHQFNQSEYELRDYCLNPLIVSLAAREKKEKEAEENKKKNATADGMCCECPMSEKQLKVQEREKILEIHFQDYLQNQVYIKRLNIAATTIRPTSVSTAARYLLNPYTESSKKSLIRLQHQRKKYSQTNNALEQKRFTCQPQSEEVQKIITTTGAPEGNESDVNVSSTTPKAAIEDKPMEFNKENTFLKADVYEKRKFIIPGLGHFEDYKIEVIACHTRPSDPLKEMLCGNPALGFGRTLPDDKADSINSSLVTINFLKNKTGAVYIKWPDPPHPNGFILTYDLEYMNPNIKNVKPILLCITYAEYRDGGKGGYLLDKLDPGNYTFRLRATSLAGNGTWTKPLSFKIPDLSKVISDKTMVIAVSVTCVIAIPVAIIIVWFLAKRKYIRKARGGVLISTNPDYPEMSYYIYEPDEWEVSRDNVELIKELGQGSFGMVYMGVVKNLVSGGETIDVAVKTTNANSNDQDRYQFLQEASMMKQFSCPHVVKLIGIVSQGQPTYVLMELMLNGDLKHFLLLHRPDEDNDGRQPPTLKQILQMSAEIADGMAYLADKKFVHRDLAARNCMVAGDMTVKIGDFGMTRDIYETDYYRKGSRGLLPVRWMPPEALKDGVFTSMTDVWSFGVVLWEMATLAAQPYQGLSNEQVLKYVSSGKIMDAPDGCPTRLYDLMVKCWRYRPKQRPTFKEIIEILLPDLDQSFEESSYFFSEESAKYEEAKQCSAALNKKDVDDLESIDKDEEGEDPERPMNDYVDEARLPMLGVGASNGHDLELQDICNDPGTYPHYSSCSYNNRRADGSAEICDCHLYREQAGASGHPVIDIYRRNHCPSPSMSAKGGSSDGSKESSKSSNSSYAHMNGLSVANGHVPLHLRTTPC